MGFIDFPYTTGTLLAVRIRRGSTGAYWQWSGAGSPAWATAASPFSDFSVNLTETTGLFSLASAPTGFSAATTAGERISVEVLLRTGATITDAEWQSAPVGAAGDLIWDGSALVTAAEYRASLALPASGYTAPDSAATIAAAVWANGTRTLSSFGTLVSDVATAVWAAATRTLTTISDSSGVTTLLSRLTATRADKLDNVAQVGSPMFLADGSIDEPVIAQEVYDAIAAAAAGSVAATTVVRGGLKLIVDADPTGTGESFETIYIGSRPTLRVHILDRQGKPVPIAASHTATFTDLVTGTEVASVAGTRRGDDTGITDIIVPAACTASAMRLNLTLEWLNGSGLTEIAGGTVVEVQAQ